MCLNFIFFINTYMKYSVKSILFLGVGGISMHQLALFFKSMGAEVFGYDVKLNKYTKMCENSGIAITNKFNKTFCDVDLCVCSGGVKNKKYFSYLKKLNVPIIDRADLLGWICSKFKTVIAVAGTHGKTTTATLIYETLKKDGRKVSCHIGGEIDNARLNFNDDILVVEACEYKKSFLKIKPTISVVTNVECEHMECYKTLFNLQSAFLTFVKKAKMRFAFQEKNTNFLKKCNKIKFVSVENFLYKPKLLGEHNLKNISLASAVARYFGIEEDVIENTIKNFGGVKRRYELIGKYKEQDVYIDYAHHPTEVKAFVSTFLSQEEKGQIIFQPHTFSRTKAFCAEFVDIFKNLKNIIIYEEYAAREKKTEGMTAKELYLQIKKVNNSVFYCANEQQLIKHIKNERACAFVGAGDINLVAENLVNNRR